MGSLANNFSDVINILDAGAGTGILAAAILDKIQEKKSVKMINLDLYETDETILPILDKNIRDIKSQLTLEGINLSYKIINENFILSNSRAWILNSSERKYDIVISNPPYKKINKSSPESELMANIIHGQPNLYFLFMAMGCTLLKPDGELIYIVPRSFTSGLYFSKFRKWFFKIMKVVNIHLFVSRDNVFNHDTVLQETIILKCVKEKVKPDTISITKSDSWDISNPEKLTVPYDTCLNESGEYYLYLPTSQDEIDALEFVNHWDSSLVNSGYKAKTGVVVDFREKQWLTTEKRNDTIPLLWSYNFNNNTIVYPINCNGKPQFLINCSETSRLKMNCDNYVLLKRFSSKEEAKRLQCALFFKDDYPEYKNISTENHLNYITKINGNLSKAEMYGIFVILNSTYFDSYYRVLNGSTQVNASEINSIPFPSPSEIEEIGNLAMNRENIPTELECNEILIQRRLS